MRAAVFFATACLAGLAASARADDDVLVAPASELAGVSQAEWSARWWQWAFSFDRASSPVADRTGEHCASRQSGNVWFLAGTYGSKRVERECTVPPGKTLFFPLINYVMFRREGSRASCAFLASQAIAATEHPSGLVLEVDGRRYVGLTAHRVTTRCFSLAPGQEADAAGSGYYVAIKPLSRGRHVLEFGGLLPDLAQAVTYHITVE